MQKESATLAIAAATTPAAFAANANANNNKTKLSLDQSHACAFIDRPLTIRWKTSHEILILHSS